MESLPEYTRYLKIDDLGLDEQNRYCLRVALEDIHLSRARQVHGGMLFTLLDAAMGRAAMSHAGADYFCPTVEMKINYFRPAASGVLRAQARVVNASRQLLYAEGDILGERDQLIARATGTFFIKPRPSFVNS